MSVLIPARNEADNIVGLLNDLSAQSFPRTSFEVIVADDHSSDETFVLAQKFFESNPGINGRVLKCPGHVASKKNVLSFAVDNSRGDIIITTDADCRPASNDWISHIISAFDDPVVNLVAGPVILHHTTGWKELFVTEALGLAAITAGSICNKKPMICNGANLAFRRRVFGDAGGYSGSDHASGDDTQLMLNVSGTDGDGVSFTRHPAAAVYTHLPPTLNDFINQRKRWVSKIPSTLSAFTVCMAVNAWLVHVLLLMHFIAFISGALNGILFLISMSVVVVPELLLITQAGKFFGQRVQPWKVILWQLLYWIYIILAGLSILTGGIEWKGRRSK